MRRLYGASEAQVTDFCDRCHAYKITNDPKYAADVQAGRTTRWGFPQRDYDNSTPPQPVGNWFVEVDEDLWNAKDSLVKL